MRFREGTPRQKALFGLIVGIFCALLSAYLYKEGRHMGEPGPGFILEVGGFLRPVRPDVKDAGLVYGSRPLAVNGVAVTTQSWAHARQQLHAESGAVNLLRIRRPDGQVRDIAVAVAPRTWSRGFYAGGLRSAIGCLIFLTGLSVFLLRPNTPAAWGVLCLGSFWGGFFVHGTVQEAGETLYSLVGAVGWGLVSIVSLHLALVLPEPHPLLQRRRHVLLWVYGAATFQAGLAVLSWRFVEQGHIDRQSVLNAICLGLALGTVAVYLARLLTLALRSVRPLTRQRAWVLLVGTALALVPGTVIGILRLAFGLMPGLDHHNVNLMVLAFPLSLGYVTVRHELFDARVAVRRVVAYGLAGAGALALVWVGALVSPVLSAVCLVPVLYLWPRFNAGLIAMLYPHRAAFPDLRRAIGDALLGSTTQEEVLHVLAGAPARVCDAQSGAAFVLPGMAGAGERVTSSGEVDVSDLHDLSDEPLVQTLVASREVIKRESLRVDPRFAKISTEARACMDRLNASVLLPIEREGQVIGGLAVGPHVSGDVFDPAELELLSELAHQAVHALSLAELRERSSDADAGTATQPMTATGTEEIRLPAVANGRYVAERLLGEGGFKRVYLARDTRLQREVALAMIRPERLSEAGRRRIEREAQAMARFGTHAHIVAVHDIGEDAGDLYIVTEYMPGGDLTDRLAAGALPLADAIRIAVELCDALAAAHAAEIVHRDLKPGNVWFTSTHSAKLGDFGLALAEDESRITEDGAIVGTVAYMSPEQARGQTPVPQSDLYALGVVLYEMLTGRLPFTGTPAVILDQHKHATPTAPSTHNAVIPPALDALVLQLLAKAPADRPPSAAAVREHLQHITHPLSDTDTEELPARPPTAAPATADTFVGREAEMMRAEGLLAAAVRGQGKVLLLVGEPGIGKTRLATECVTRAEAQGMRVLWGRCYEGAGAPAFWPWVQILRDYVRDADAEQLRAELGDGAPHVAQVVSDVRTRLPETPEPPTVEGEAARFLLFDATTRFLKRAADAQPLMLVLDDLHWADKSSLLLVHFLAQAMADAPLFVLGTYREVEVDRDHPLAELLGQLAREPVSRRLHLGGLSTDAVAELVEATAVQSGDVGLTAAVYDSTEGNPFFIKETLRHLADTGGDIADMGVPEGVRDVIRLRLSRLPAECTEVLSIGAVVGREFDAGELERITGLTGDALWAVLEQGARAGLIRERRTEFGRWAFTHALIRETLYEDLSAPRRARLHRQVGEVLETVHAGELKGHLPALAYHFVEGLPAGVDADRAVDYAVRAAERATEQQGYDDAVAQYDRALDVLISRSPIDEVQECRLRLALGRALVHAGEAPRAEETLLQVCDLSQRATAVHQFVEAVSLLGQLRYVYGAADEHLTRLIEDGLALLPDDDSAERVSLLALLSRSLGAVPGAEDRREALSAQALEMARRVGDAEATVYALRSRLNLFAVPLEERLEAAVEFVDRATHMDRPEWIALGLAVRSSLRLEVGDVSGSHADVAALVQLAERIPLPEIRSHAACSQVVHAILVGRFDEAETCAVQALRSGQLVKRINATQTFAGHLGTLRWVQGRLAELESAMPQPGDRDAALPIYRAYRALLHLDIGRPAEARTEFEALAAQDFADLPADWNRLTLLAMLTEVATALDDTDRAARLYALLSRYADRMIMQGSGNFCLGSAQHWLAVLAAVLQRWAQAEAHFEAALEMNERIGARPFLAKTQYEYARMLLARGHDADRDKARDLLTAAATTADELGMPPLQTKAEELLATV